MVLGTFNTTRVKDAHCPLPNRPFGQLLVTGNQMLVYSLLLYNDFLESVMFLSVRSISKPMICGAVAA